ncbi:aromatic alcohol reductase [Xanthobacter wiegelii]|uniref:aromatic alcohol reductase n=1 Tax=Xanthobacter wiegelii TaxID=3119913 RepID=UPI0037269D63
MTVPPILGDHILVLGAGELGLEVLNGLTGVTYQCRNLHLSALLRPVPANGMDDRPGKISEILTALNVDIVRIDIATASQDELAHVFSRFSTVICCTGFVGGSGTQLKITSAVLQAGVKLYVPWQFGVDYDVVGRGSGQDVWDEQLDVRDMLRAQSRTHWIIISTGMFISFLFEPSFGLVDLDRNRVHALGNWDYRLTVTTPHDIGRLVAAILTAVPSPIDQVVYVGGDTISYRELADTVDRVLSRSVERVLWTVSDLRADLKAHPDDPIRKYRLAFARSDGVAWPLEQTFNALHDIPVTSVAAWLEARGAEDNS